MNRPSRLGSLPACLAAVCLALAGCGGSGQTAVLPPASAAPETTTSTTASAASAAAEAVEGGTAAVVAVSECPEAVDALIALPAGFDGSDEHAGRVLTKVVNSCPPSELSAYSQVIGQPMSEEESVSALAVYCAILRTGGHPEPEGC